MRARDAHTPINGTSGDDSFNALPGQEGRLPFAASELIAANGFDYVYYLSHYPDVAAACTNPFQHFQTLEGRDQNALFDLNRYLANYADVAAAHINVLDHYDWFGLQEGSDAGTGQIENWMLV